MIVDERTPASEARSAATTATTATVGLTPFACREAVPDHHDHRVAAPLRPVVRERCAQR